MRILKGIHELTFERNPQGFFAEILSEAFQWIPEKIIGFFFVSVAGEITEKNLEGIAKEFIGTFPLEFFIKEMQKSLKDLLKECLDDLQGNSQVYGDYKGLKRFR